jgi:hypothetical protein
MPRDSSHTRANGAARQGSRCFRNIGKRKDQSLGIFVVDDLGQVAPIWLVSFEAVVGAAVGGSHFSAHFPRLAPAQPFTQAAGE